MRKNIESVLNAWLNGTVYHERTCHTDGTTVWSYALPIAKRVLSSGKRGGSLKTLYHVRKADSSGTTNSQINAVRDFLTRAGLKVIEVANVQ
jgi:hypothetical protein